MSEITDPFARTLILSAASAVEDEERELARAFATFPRRSADGHTTYHRQGLAYAVYETTLCYVIWKRWLTIVEDAVWEDHPPDTARKMVDLQVHTHDATYLFEAKWWLRDSNALLDKEAQRLREMGRDTSRRYHRYLLTFWWNKGEPDPWLVDGPAVEAAAKDLQARAWHAHKFSTRCHPELGAQMAWQNFYFAIAAFELTP